MLEIIDPGLFCSLQDEGRIRQGGFALPFSGAMDQHSFQLANHILKNDAQACCLEFTSPGPKLKFHQPATITLTGAKATVWLNGSSLESANNQIFNLQSGDILHIKNLQHGTWGYLAVKGGFLTETVLGSKSFSPGITEYANLQKNTQLHFSEDATMDLEFNAKIKPEFPWEHAGILTAWQGPEFNLLPEEMKKRLETSTFSFTTEKNRMAAPLDGLIGENKLEILTSPIFPGTVQLTPSGRLILLLREAQVTGGYPRILHLPPDQQDLAAQMKPKQNFRFEILKR